MRMSGPARLSGYAALAVAASAVSLTSVFTGAGWVIPVMGCILLVSVVNAAVRQSPIPTGLGPPLAAAAVLLWVNALDAHQSATLGVLPNRASLSRLDAVTRTGFNDIDRLVTPVPTHRGLVLLTMAGVTVCALLVDLLVVTMRRAALAGLPLLGLYATDAAVARHGVPVLEFVVGAVGFLGLLYADGRERLSRWGRSVGDSGSGGTGGPWSGDDTRAPASLGRRIGAASVGFGIVVPLLIPGLHGGVPRHGHGNNGTGGGNIVTVNPIVSVASDLHSSADIPVMSYTTTAPAPGYLRLTALDSFDGSTFSSPELVAPATARVDRGLHVTPGAGPAVTTKIDVAGSLDAHWLPVPVTATAVTVAGDWRYDPGTATIFSASASTRGLSYTVTSTTPDPSAAQLIAAGSSDDVSADDRALPDNLSPRVAALARRVTAHATTSYGRAMAIQDFLTSSRFQYDTQISPVPGPDALTDFLFHTRRGFCQQFATAMAVMAREVGIPSRVAVGFTRGAPQPDGSWLVTTHDAHAWPELYFDGIGWLAFEPTPRGDGQTVTPSYAINTSGGKAAANQGQAPKPSKVPTTNPDRRPDGGRDLTGSSSPTSVHHHRRSADPVVALAVLAVLVGLAAMPMAWRETRRRRRLRAGPTPAADAWAELRDTAIDLKIAFDDDRSPRQIASRLATDERLASSELTALTQLVSAEERDRYAAQPVAVTGLGDAVRTVTAGLRGRRNRRQRLRATLLPRSVVDAARLAMGTGWDRMRARLVMPSLRRAG